LNHLEELSLALIYLNSRMPYRLTDIPCKNIDSKFGHGLRTNLVSEVG